MWQHRAVQDSIEQLYTMNKSFDHTSLLKGCAGLARSLTRFVSILATLYGVSVSAAIITPMSGVIDTAIPDNDANGITSVLNVSGATENILDITVTLNLTVPGGGSFNGDYYVYLSHATITGFAVLLNRPGKTAANPVGTDGAGYTNVVFDDAAANGDIHIYETTLGAGFNNGDALTGIWAPDGRNVDPDNVVDSDNRTALLNSFDGQLPNGDWTLFIADMASGGTLTLNEWSMQITLVPEPKVHALIVGFGLLACAFLRRSKIEE